METKTLTYTIPSNMIMVTFGILESDRETMIKAYLNAYPDRWNELIENPDFDDELMESPNNPRMIRKYPATVLIDNPEFDDEQEVSESNPEQIVVPNEKSLDQFCKDTITWFNSQILEKYHNDTNTKIVQEQNSFTPVEVDTTITAE